MKTKGDNCHITVKMRFKKNCLRRFVLWLAVVMITVTIMVSVIQQTSMLTINSAWITDRFQNRITINDRKCVIILAYLRSGSTFTADVIQQHPDIYYLYEPFYSVIGENYYTNNGVCRFLDGNCSKSIHDREQLTWVRRSIGEIITCKNFTNITDLFTFTDTNEGATFERLSHCKLNTIYNNSCLLDEEARCIQSIPTIKTIRLQMDSLEPLFQTFSGLKVIHLIRDPRGMLESRLRLGFGKVKELYVLAREICSRYKRDLDTAKTLMQLYPNRIKIVAYENIATNPLEMSRDIYSFLSLTLTSNIEEWIKHATSLGSKHNGNYKTVRPNSTQVAYGWKERLTIENIQIIDRECNYLYQELGYKPGL